MLHMEALHGRRGITTHGRIYSNYLRPTMVERARADEVRKIRTSVLASMEGKTCHESQNTDNISIWAYGISRKISKRRVLGHVSHGSRGGYSSLTNRAGA